jgi:hypothetical protein
MAFQTTITRSPALGVEGMVADSNELTVDSKLVKAATLAPGRAVRVATADAATDYVTVPAAAAEVTGDATNPPCFGVTMWDGTALSNPYVANDPVPVVRVGVVWVISEAATNPTLPVYIRHTANGGNTTIGGFSSAAGTGLSLAPAGWRWASSQTATTGLAKLQINLP